MSSKVHLTFQRKAIYEVVRQAKDHPTAADVMDRLRDQGMQFAYGTIYNSLRYLADSGLIQELKLGGATSRYDGNVADHQHIVCQVCGRVDEVYTDLPGNWQSAVAGETNYAVITHQVVLTGVCPKCRGTSG